MRDSLTDEEAAQCFELVDVWVACPPAPKEVWSLAEALRWATTQSGDVKVSLYRPPGGAFPSAWLSFEQVCRLVRVLDGSAKSAA